MKTLLIILAAALMGGCASTSTEGLSKDQIERREKSREAWSMFGRDVAGIAVNQGVVYLSRTHAK